MSSESDRLKCFVVSPIGQPGSEIREHMDTVFECMIEPALRDRYDVIRGDHTVRPGRVTEQFVECILHNDLIVCVLTGNNPNVYYELAIAESAAQPIIVLRHRGDDVPFDVKNVRYIEYDLDPRRIYSGHYIELIRQAERELASKTDQERRVPFMPSLTPLGESRLNFKCAPRYDSISSEVNQVLQAAQKVFFFCGMSLNGWIGNEGFRAEIRRQADAGVDCRFLLMDPENPALGQMLSVENQRERVAKDIQVTYEHLQDLAKRSNGRLGVRFVRRGLVYQQMALSERSMIWAPHLFARQTGQCPALRVDTPQDARRNEGLEPMYEAMRDEFERLWSENA